MIGTNVKLVGGIDRGDEVDISAQTALPVHSSSLLPQLTPLSTTREVVFDLNARSKENLAALRADLMYACQFDFPEITQEQLDSRIDRKLNELKETASLGIVMSRESLELWVKSGTHGTVWDHLASHGHDDPTKLFGEPTFNRKSLSSDYLRFRATVEEFLSKLGAEYQSIKPRYHFIKADTIRDQVAGAPYGIVSVEVLPPPTTYRIYHFGDSFTGVEKTEAGYSFNPQNLLMGSDALTAKAMIEVARDFFPPQLPCFEARSNKFELSRLEDFADKYVESLVYSELPFDTVVNVQVSVRNNEALKDLATLMGNPKIRPLLTANVDPNAFGPVTVAWLLSRFTEKSMVLIDEVRTYAGDLPFKIDVTGPLSTGLHDLSSVVRSYEAEISRHRSFVTTCSNDINSLGYAFGKDIRQSRVPITEELSQKIKQYIALRRDHDVLSQILREHPEI